MDLLGKIFWVALTAVFTFGFVVLYENGPTNYVNNATHEFNDLKTYFMAPAKKKPDAPK